MKWQGASLRCGFEMQQAASTSAPKVNCFSPGLRLTSECHRWQCRCLLVSQSSLTVFAVSLWELLVLPVLCGAGRPRPALPWGQRAVEMYSWALSLSLAECPPVLTDSSFWNPFKPYECPWGQSKCEESPPLQSWGGTVLATPASWGGLH